MLNLRDRNQRIRYRHIVERRRDSHFPAADKIIRGVFSTEKRIMIAALPKVGKPNRAAWEAAFKRIWIMVGIDSWAFSEETWGTAHRNERAKPKAIWALYYKYKTNPTWLNYVNDYIDGVGGDKITEISDHTQELVKGALKEGIANDESIPDIAKRISSLYDGFDTGRSTTIARSETVDAFNQASLEQARDAGSTLDLMWITAGDDRVRPEHEAMDGETVAYDQEFDCEDGTTMPGEAVNCRCTIGYAVPSEPVEAPAEGEVITEDMYGGMYGATFDPYDLPQAARSDEVYDNFNDASNAFGDFIGYKNTEPTRDEILQYGAMKGWILDYNDIQDALRYGEVVKNAEEYTPVLESIVTNGPQYEGVAYRGFAPGEKLLNILDNAQVGDIIKDRGFTAVTTDKSFALDFPTARANFYDAAAPKNQVIYTIENAKGAALPGVAQHEVLLSPNTPLEVIDKKTTTWGLELILRQV